MRGTFPMWVLEMRGIHRRLEIRDTDRLSHRFWSRVDKRGPDECWNWTACFRNGYGAIKHNKRVLSAHRVAYVLTFGEPDSGLVIAHKCDNRSCCNPDHLEAISPRQNAIDAKARIPHRYPIGAEMPNVKLSDTAVRAIRKLSEVGLSQREIAESVGVCKSVVGRVLSGEGWRHVS